MFLRLSFIHTISCEFHLKQSHADLQSYLTNANWLCIAFIRAHAWIFSSSFLRGFQLSIHPFSLPASLCVSACRCVCQAACLLCGLPLPGSGTSVPACLLACLPAPCSNAAPTLECSNIAGQCPHIVAHINDEAAKTCYNIAGGTGVFRSLHRDNYVLG